MPLSFTPPLPSKDIQLLLPIVVTNAITVPCTITVTTASLLLMLSACEPLAADGELLEPALGFVDQFVKHPETASALLHRNLY